MNEMFYHQVYAVVSEIPVGYVATYQLIAQLIGYPHHCRMVGKALRFAHLYGDFPCYRVVHSDGSLVFGWDEQKTLLENEKVIFKNNGKVDMKQCLWSITV